MASERSRSSNNSPACLSSPWGRIARGSLVQRRIEGGDININIVTTRLTYMCLHQNLRAIPYQS
eukprot:scaffold8363_cov163-Amphora_coffeaeformis.AAC.1